MLKSHLLSSKWKQTNLYLRIFNFQKYIIYYYGLAVWVFIPRTIEQILGIYPTKIIKVWENLSMYKYVIVALFITGENLEYVDTQQWESFINKLQHVTL